MRLYYKTTTDAAKLILSEGFKGDSIRLTELTGVWLSDLMLNLEEYEANKKILAVDLDIPEDELDEYEKAEDVLPYKEYFLPAKVVNEKSVIQIVKEKSEKETAFLSYLDDLSKEK